MCDQRERLIGYVYGEGDEGDLGEVQKHLDACPDCRAEIAGLRSVREDLLAWDVPAHESVWRPFVVAPVTPWWRQVPAWAVAAAAAVMVLLGATGSVVARAFGPDQTMARQADVVAAPGAPVLTEADLSAAEQRMLARMQQEVGAVGARVQQVSNRSQAVQVLESDHNAIADELIRLRQQNREQFDAIKSIYASLDKMRNVSASSNANLEQKINDLRSLVTSQLPLK